LSPENIVSVLPSVGIGLGSAEFQHKAGASDHGGGSSNGRGGGVGGAGGGSAVQDEDLLPLGIVFLDPAFSHVCG